MSKSRFDIYYDTLKYTNKEDIKKTIENILNSDKKKQIVIGEVQSGKTTNFCCLINKAIDMGYKRIIVLTGVIESLRVQTQKRINESVIGFEYVGEKLGRKECKILNNDLLNIGGVETATTTKYSGKADGLINMSPNPNTTWIMCIKKNHNTLKKLIKNSGFLLTENKILIVDDECDNATLNCKRFDKTRTNNELSTINKLIKQLIKNKKSKYVGYTATPFLNFQNLLTDNLTPEEYFYLNIDYQKYSGLDAWFEENRNDIEIVEDENYNDIDNISFSKELKKMIDDFITKGSVFIKNNEKDHFCMLINISHKKGAHSQMSNLIKEYLNKKIVDINVNDDEKQFIEILLDNGIKVINSENDHNISELDFNIRKICIFIGGYALARGITLEGLHFTYLNRRKTNVGVLLQMARFFGYHKNNSQNKYFLKINQTSYDDFCRVQQMMKKTRGQFKGLNCCSIEHEKFYIYVDENVRVPARQTAKGSITYRVQQLQEIRQYDDIPKNCIIFQKNEIDKLIQKYSLISEPETKDILEVLENFNKSELITAIKNNIKGQLSYDTKWKIVICNNNGYRHRKSIGNKYWFEHVITYNDANSLFHPSEQNNDENMNVGTFLENKNYHNHILFLLPTRTEIGNSEKYVLSLSFYFPKTSKIVSNDNELKLSPDILNYIDTNLYYSSDEED